MMGMSEANTVYRGGEAAAAGGGGSDVLQATRAYIAKMERLRKIDRWVMGIAMGAYAAGLAYVAYLMFWAN